MFVIGTAGHIDHGKSTLVKALTGTDSDRLKEEKARAMTIELGFAWMVLDGGLEVGIVDVPGHRDFIENMLAGVGGIDAVLLVIAADEGVMPQTREHLAIIDLLQIPRGIVVLTKTDLVDDPEWLDLQELEISNVLQGSVLESAEIVRVSAVTGEGIDKLREKLRDLLGTAPTRRDIGTPRLSIDRVFSLQGFGTVVTGTLLDGSMSVGDELVLMPKRIKARVRGLQTHKRTMEKANPGSRVAVNLIGVETADIARGDVLCLPDTFQGTSLINVDMRLLKDSKLGLKHNQELKLFLGAAEAAGRVRLIGQDTVQPGGNGWAQIELETKIVAAKGDKFIIRRPSPAETIGGGVVLEAQPAKKEKRYHADVLSRFETIAGSSLQHQIMTAFHENWMLDEKQIIEQVELPANETVQGLNMLLQEGKLLRVDIEGGSPFYIMVSGSGLVNNKAISLIQDFHAKYPLKRGMPKEEFRQKLGLTKKENDVLLTYWKQISQFKEQSNLIASTQFEIQLSQRQRQSIERILEKFSAAPYSPPARSEVEKEIGHEVLESLLDSGDFVATSADVIFYKKAYEEMLAWVHEHFDTHDLFTVGEFRDHFQTSRKYALSFLEHLDQKGITRREGEGRVLGKVK